MSSTPDLADKVILLKTIQSSEGRKTVVELNNHEAQTVLTLLQQELDTSKNPVSRQTALKVMIHLAKRSRQLPPDIMLSNVSLGRRVSEGLFGVVYEGSWRSGSIEVPIALKSSWGQPDVQSARYKHFCQEALLWRQLTHRNILPFLGLYLEGPPMEAIMMVSPWMRNGHILEYLKNEPDADRFQLLVDAAEGLTYLHQHDPPVFHSDLKPENILIDDCGRALLADFGATRVQHELADLLSSTQNVGTEVYMSPEFLKRGKSTKSSDIWALGMVVYQVFTGQRPYQGVRVPFYQICKSPPTLPSTKEDAINLGFTDELWELGKSCWAELPRNRPTAENCGRRLKDLASAALLKVAPVNRA